MSVLVFISSCLQIGSLIARCSTLRRNRGVWCGNCITACATYLSGKRVSVPHRPVYLRKLSFLRGGGNWPVGADAPDRCRMRTPSGICNPMPERGRKQTSLLPNKEGIRRYYLQLHASYSDHFLLKITRLCLLPHKQPCYCPLLQFATGSEKSTGIQRIIWLIISV